MSGVRAFSCDWHRPIIFRYARPENPYHNDREECEEGFEESPVNLAIGASTYVGANDVLEDLTNGEEEGGGS